ncbi:Hsp70 family protein [Dactylosporangium sp. NPDC050588]|uniref:Hsp70 family protein n=1 Tax=Dactylosporangium sp. NPDC050588 TaxID=3157211 RepID=UPI0034049C94
MAHDVLLGIDFGTFNTVAMVRRGGGEARSLLFDGSPLLPSAVLLEGAGDVLSGAEAVRSARVQPDRYEPNPKRRMADGIVLLGGHETDVVDLVAAVLGRVAAEARQVVGQLPDRVVVTHPEIWGASRLSRLTEAVVRAGLPGPMLVSEPIAAAAYFLGQGGRVGAGQCAVVYDFGAGTFDAGVVRRGPAGALTVLASEGLPEVGGLDLDAALVEHLGRLIAQRDPDGWDRLRRPATAADRRARWQLWEDVRLAKESLSRRSQTLVHLPVLDETVPVSRDEFEQLAEPVIARTVAVTRAAVRSAGIGLSDVGGVFLVGGSSRVPLVATLLHRAFGMPPTVLEQPELVVAEGALILLDACEERTPTGVTMRLPADGGSQEAAAQAGATAARPAPVPQGSTQGSTQSSPQSSPQRVVQLAPASPTAGRAPRSDEAAEPGRGRSIRRHLTDPWSVAAAVLLGALSGTAGGLAGASTAAVLTAGAVVAVIVHTVRVALGIVFDR